jgi:hypothetical protein
MCLIFCKSVTTVCALGGWPCVGSLFVYFVSTWVKLLHVWRKLGLYWRWTSLAYCTQYFWGPWRNVDTSYHVCISVLTGDITKMCVFGSFVQSFKISETNWWWILCFIELTWRLYVYTLSLHRYNRNLNACVLSHHGVWI